jgi:hypothetical protein
MEQLDCGEVVAHDDLENIWRRCTTFRRQQVGPVAPARDRTRAARRDRIPRDAAAPF